MKDWKCLLVSAAFITSGLMANDGVLPRGKGQQPAASPVTTSVPELYSKEDEKLFPIDCSTYLANPNNGEFFIAPGKQLLYFLSRSAGEAQRVDAKTYIYEIDLNARNSRRIVGLKLDTNPIMIGHGLPLEGASVFDLKKGRASCGEGVSAGVGVQWAKQQRIVKNFLSSRYKLIATDQGNNFADLDQGIVQGFDFTTLQKRTLTTFPKDHVPLYAEFQPPKVIAVQPEKAELHLFTGGNKQPDSILVLKKGAKFVQNGGLFGLLEIGTEPQKIQLRTIKGWSGEAFRSHSMELPKEWNVDNIRVDYDFLSEVALIQAPDFKLRRGAVAPQFRNVLLYNKAKNTPLAELTVPKDQYFGMVTLAPEGKLVYALVKSMADDGARTFKIWSIEDGKWLEDINLTRESVTEPASKGKSKG